MLRELKTFIAVARLGSFAGAGDQIGLTQSAVSAQVARLEEDLGFVLFERSGRAARLNTAGREALARAEEIVGLYRQLGQQAHDPARPALIRVGAVASVQEAWLPRALAAFRNEMPDCRVRIEPGVSLSLLGQVDAGEIDIAVMIRPPFEPPAELAWRSLAREPFVCLAPANARGDWRELLEQLPFIRYDHASFGGRLVDQFLRRQRINVRESIELDELRAMSEMVAQGLGVALVPRIALLAQVSTRVRIMELGRDVFYREIGLLERPAHGRQPVASLFAEHIALAAESVKNTIT